METPYNSMEPSLKKCLAGHRKSITALYFNPSAKQIASSSLENSVLLWDVHGIKRSHRLFGHEAAVMDVTFSPSGRYLASASQDKTVRLWVPTVIGSTGMFKAHSQTVRSVQFNYDESKIITASDDKTVKLWSTRKQKFISSYVGHTNWVRCARLSSDGSVIASCSDDKTTRLWDPDSKECIHIFKDQKGNGLCVAWHPTGCYVAIGTSHGVVKLYDVRTHSLVQYYSIHDDAVTGIAFHPSGSFLLTSSKDSKMRILDLLEGHPIYTLRGHTGSINAVNFTASGETFASAGDDKLIFIWRTNFATLVKENMQENASITPKSASQMDELISPLQGKTQGTRAWSLCYHSTKIPVSNFVHLDDVHESTYDTMNYTTFSEESPNANSSLIESNIHSQTEPHMPQTSAFDSPIEVNSNRPLSSFHSHDVGHMSHIPRTPPTPATYTIPSIRNVSRLTTGDHVEDLFGMIKLQDNDVCYTSGTIEWVGRKRSYPINSGFKVIEQGDDTHKKKLRKLNQTFTTDKHNLKECDCADVLPTVNAIVDHLNALHEAVDLVDLRLNTLEDVHG